MCQGCSSAAPSSPGAAVPSCCIPTTEHGTRRSAKADPAPAVFCSWREGSGERHRSLIGLLATRFSWGEVGFWEAVADCSILSCPDAGCVVTQTVLLPNARAGVLHFPFCFDWRNEQNYINLSSLSCNACKGSQLEKYTFKAATYSLRKHTISGTGSMVLALAETGIARVSAVGLVGQLALAFSKQVIRLCSHCRLTMCLPFYLQQKSHPWCQSRNSIR